MFAVGGTQCLDRYKSSEFIKKKTMSCRIKKIVKVCLQAVKICMKDQLPVLTIDNDQPWSIEF